MRRNKYQLYAAYTFHSAGARYIVCITEMVNSGNKGVTSFVAARLEAINVESEIEGERPPKI
jgi:hypothetical protein